jgi:hypothetical protein
LSRETYRILQLNLKDALESCLSVLRDLGYFVTVRDKSIQINRTYAVPMTEATHAYMYASQILMLMSKVDNAAAFEALGMELFITNVEDGFDTIYGSAL